MRGKILNLLLIFTSLAGYMEWGGNNHTFLILAEGQVLLKQFSAPGTGMHPFVVLPFVGQLLLVYTLFMKQPSKILTYIGIAFIGLLLGFILLIGAFSFNIKVLASTIPFFVVVVITLRHYRNKKTIPVDLS